MSSVIELSNIIEGYYSFDRVDKALALLQELRSGKYYSASKKRNFLIGNYKGIVASLTANEYDVIKPSIIEGTPKLISDRNSRKIAYSLLSQIIEYSCYGADVEVYQAYEKEVLRLADINKDKYLYHMITLATTRQRLLGEIDGIEDYFIKRYLPISRMKTINYRYLIDFTMNVKASNKRKFLGHLYRSRPFRNEHIIKSFILQFDELSKLGSLL